MMVYVSAYRLLFFSMSSVHIDLFARPLYFPHCLTHEAET